MNGLRQTPAVEFYYEPGDPHSHLAAQLLPMLIENLKAPLKIFVVSQEESPIYPELERQRHYNLLDARRIAPAWGLHFPSQAQAASSEQRQLAAQTLLPLAENPDAFCEKANQLAKALFAGESLEGKVHPETITPLQNNNVRRSQLGHYLPAMWKFNGQWFWGVDRFNRLLSALAAKKLWQGQSIPFTPSAANLPTPAAGTPVECFLSFRSPYSYLAAVQLQRQRATLPVELIIKPVLPMAMRGFKVPLAKRLYILRDAAREARRLNIDFGFAVDPIGEGALRALRAFTQTNGNQQALDFMVSAGQAAWGEALDLASDEGLRTVCERAGVAWSQVQSLLVSQPIDYAEDNRNALFEAGLWGVPGFRIGDFATWGQDRLWMVEEIVKRQKALQ